MIDRENSMILSENATDNIVTIPPGNYTEVSLGVALELALDAAGVNAYTVTYNSSNHRFTITSVGAASVIILYISSVRLRELLGMDMNNVFSPTLVSPFAATTAVEQSLRIISDICNEETLIDMIDLNIGGGTVSWSSADVVSDSRTLHIGNSNVFSFRLVNEDNALINLNGPDMSLILYFY